MAKSLDIIDPKKDLKTEEDSDQMHEDIVEPKGSGGGAFYLVLGIIALVVAISTALYILYKDKNNTNDTSSVATQSVTATPVVTGTTTLTPVASSTVAAITTQVAQTTFQYTNEKIRVANGNGISGEGQKIKAVLISAGFQVASVGNASKQYSETFVFYKTGQQDLAEALKNAIKDSYTATIKEDNSVVGTYDAVIALGSK